MNKLELKGKRVSKGLKQSDVAIELGITAKTFCVYENSDRCKFDLDQIKELSRLYCLNLDDINIIFFDKQLPIGNEK